MNLRRKRGRSVTPAPVRARARVRLIHRFPIGGCEREVDFTRRLAWREPEIETVFLAKALLGPIDDEPIAHGLENGFVEFDAIGKTLSIELQMIQHVSTSR